MIIAACKSLLPCLTVAGEVFELVTCVCCKKMEKNFQDRSIMVLGSFYIICQVAAPCSDDLIWLSDSLLLI